VSQTGAFCLGHSEEEHTRNPMWNISNTVMMFPDKMGHCPKIHFITGISEKVGNDSKAIIAYGVSDCLPRIIEVEKSEIATMLWNAT
jgi:hypothetical protein